MTWRNGLAGALCIAAVLQASACAHETDRDVTAPRPSTGNMTDAEREALIMAHDTAFARLAGGLMHPGGPSRMYAYDDPNYSEEPSPSANDPESLVTTSGTVAGSTITVVQELTGDATWSSETKAVSGFARRVHLTTVGGYSQATSYGPLTPDGWRTQRFSGTCGDAFTDLFRQKCLLGDIYFDIDCYDLNGSIYASSQHAATFKFTTQTAQPTSHVAHCRETQYGGGGGSGCGTSTAFTIIDDFTGEGTDPCYGGGGGSDPGPTTDDPPPSGDSGGGWICVQYLLDPGCYDVYIDGQYDSTICC